MTDDGKEIPECPKFFTVAVKEIHDGLVQAIDNAIAPEQNITDLLKNAAKMGEAGNFTNIFDQTTEGVDLNSNTTTFTKSKSNSSFIEIITTEASLIIGATTTSRDISLTTNTNLIPNINITIETISSTPTFTSLASDTSLTSTDTTISANTITSTDTTTLSPTTVQQNASKAKAKKESFKSIVKGPVLWQKEKEDVAYDDNGDSKDYLNEDSIEQLERLRRDLFVANELQGLLNKLNEETVDKDEEVNRNRRGLDNIQTEMKKIGNFRESQNSQSKEFPSNNNVINNKFIDEKIRWTPKEKRFLFKKKRKKKKTKNIWRHLFGVHTDDNRFLNHNFPNSQYANYPR